MPVVKGIACHSRSSRRSVLYAAGEENPKVLARDYLNCSERDPAGRSVWEQFDAARERAGLNEPRMRVARGVDGEPVLDGRGGPLTYDSTVYYEHYIISPDPRDAPTLPQVRAVATAWARRHFGDFQVVIGYHGDTGLVHAHVLVNSPNLADGSRVTDATRGRGWGRRSWEDLQEIAREQGLSGFRDEVSGALAQEGARRQPARANERHGAVASLYASGCYSWVEDIRCRLECAALISRDEEQFRSECARLGVRVEAASRGGGWKYVMEREPSRQVSGSRLGSAWTEFGVGRRLAHDRASGRPKPRGASLAALELAIEALVAAGGRNLQILDRNAPGSLDEEGLRVVRGLRGVLESSARGSGALRFGSDPEAEKVAGLLREAGWAPCAFEPAGCPEGRPGSRLFLDPGAQTAPQRARGGGSSAAPGGGRAEGRRKGRSR